MNVFVPNKSVTELCSKKFANQRRLIGAQSIFPEKGSWFTPAHNGLQNAQYHPLPNMNQTELLSIQDLLFPDSLGHE